jgi:hypothetical protein
MGKNKVSLSSCSGMSPYGLVSRLACADTVYESENVFPSASQLHPLIEQVSQIS